MSELGTALNGIRPVSPVDVLTIAPSDGMGLLPSIGSDLVVGSLTQSACLPACQAGRQAGEWI